MRASWVRLLRRSLAAKGCRPEPLDGLGNAIETLTELYVSIILEIWTN